MLVMQARHEIDAALRRGESFSVIEEEVIERCALSDDQKSALWLYAWSFVDPRVQRREARAHLSLVCGRTHQVSAV